MRSVRGADNFATFMGRFSRAVFVELLLLWKPLPARNTSRKPSPVFDLGYKQSTEENVGSIFLLVKGKSKSVPLQAWSIPEGSRKVRFPDFMTTAQDGGKVVSLTHRPPLIPGNTTGAHFC